MKRHEFKGMGGAGQGQLRCLWLWLEVISYMEEVFLHAVFEDIGVWNRWLYHDLSYLDVSVVFIWPSHVLFSSRYGECIEMPGATSQLWNSAQRSQPTTQGLLTLLTLPPHCQPVYRQVVLSVGWTAKCCLYSIIEHAFSSGDWNFPSWC